MGASEAVWERRTLAGEAGVVGTTSGASAEFMVIVRAWPSGLGNGSWVVDVVGVWGLVDEEEERGLVSVGTSLMVALDLFLKIEGVTTCFSTSDAAFGSTRARICGSEDKGRDNGNDLGRNRFKEDREDFPLLWLMRLVYCSGIGGTLGMTISESSARDSEVKTVEVREIG